MRSTLVLFVIAGCAHPRMNPHTAGELQHENEAREHEIAGEAHAQQAQAECRADREICWTTPPRGPHAEEARRHEELGLEHSAASVELAEARRRACARVDPADRELGAFGHRDDIASVAAITEGGRLRGARIAFRAVPGLTEERLRDLVECERAELAASGHPGDATSPLAQREARARVAVLGANLIVDITANDPGEAQTILERARSSNR